MCDLTEGQPSALSIFLSGLVERIVFPADNASRIREKESGRFYAAREIHGIPVPAVRIPGGVASEQSHLHGLRRFVLYFISQAHLSGNLSIPSFFFKLPMGLFLYIKFACNKNIL